MSNFRMARVFGASVILLFILAVLWGTLRPLFYHKYIQSAECARQGSILFVPMRDAFDGQEKGNTQGMQFEDDGLVFRFWPQFYAMDWESFRGLSVNFNENYKSMGHLEFVYKSGKKMDVGFIQRSCWISMKEYVQDSGHTHSVSIGVSEVGRN